MLTLEIREQYVKWPEDFALLMIKHYEDYEVPVKVHMVCSPTGRDAKAFGLVSKYAAKPKTQLRICCHEE
jgi:hypothetical protein